MAHAELVIDIKKHITLFFIIKQTANDRANL